MKLFSGTATEFVHDTVRNQIADKLESEFFRYFRYSPGKSEVNSWRHSLRAMSDVLTHGGLMNTGVMLEYQLPLSSKRLDFMVTGESDDSRPGAVIVELKQWEECEEADGEHVVTWVGGGHREVLHPSAQVGQYRMYLQDMHTAFYEGSSPLDLSSCCYLHNYPWSGEDVLFSPKYQACLRDNPIFTKDDYDKLTSFLREKVSTGDGMPILHRVESSKLRPSKKLMDHVSSMIDGQAEYVLLDEQLVAFDKVLSCVRSSVKDSRKHCVVIQGGPGTGKSVVAINLMGKMLGEGVNVHYATGSRAFTETLRKVIGSRGSGQFKYFNSYMNVDRNALDVLVCDESHRIRKHSWSRFTPKEDRDERSQIEELLNTAKVGVFFIDDVQVVRPGEIGSSDYIREMARKLGVAVHDYKLEAQFRCSGSEAFVNWIDNTLEIRKTANVLWEGDERFDFKILESPAGVEEAIRSKSAEGNTGRMVAGFCWPWSKKPLPDGTLIDDVEIDDFLRPWNARPEATRLATGIPKSHHWARESGGIDQVGCIYTAQGFEFDYVGVIFGKDLKYDPDAGVWIGDKTVSHDTVVKRSGDRFVDLVKNTYRVLLTRGLKGCYVTFLDKNTERFFRSRMSGDASPPTGTKENP